MDGQQQQQQLLHVQNRTRAIRTFQRDVSQWLELIERPVRPGPCLESLNVYPTLASPARA
jgi:hypothetical protein